MLPKSSTPKRLPHSYFVSRMKMLSETDFRGRYILARDLDHEIQRCHISIEELKQHSELFRESRQGTATGPEAEFVALYDNYAKECLCKSNWTMLAAMSDYASHKNAKRRKTNWNARFIQRSTPASNRPVKVKVRRLASAAEKYEKVSTTLNILDQSKDRFKRCGIFDSLWGHFNAKRLNLQSIINVLCASLAGLIEVNCPGSGTVVARLQFKQLPPTIAGGQKLLTSTKTAQCAKKTNGGIRVFQNEVTVEKLPDVIRLLRNLWGILVEKPADLLEYDKNLGQLNRLTALASDLPDLFALCPAPWETLQIDQAAAIKIAYDEAKAKIEVFLQLCGVLMRRLSHPQRRWAKKLDAADVGRAAWRFVRMVNLYREAEELAREYERDKSHILVFDAPDESGIEITGKIVKEYHCERYQEIYSRAGLYAKAMKSLAQLLAGKCHPLGIDPGAFIDLIIDFDALIRPSEKPLSALRLSHQLIARLSTGALAKPALENTQLTGEWTPILSKAEIARRLRLTPEKFETFGKNFQWKEWGPQLYQMSMDGLPEREKALLDPDRGKISDRNRPESTGSNRKSRKTA